MPRKTYDVNLLHLDPIFVRYVSNGNCHARGITWTTVSGNELILQNSSVSENEGIELFGEARTIWRTAMALGCDRVRFKLNGPVLDFPMFDEADVVAEFKMGDPLRVGGFRTQDAEEAMEKLEEDPTFEETPMCYERMAFWLGEVLRKRDRSRIDVMKLESVFEQIMSIGHASAWSKEQSDNHWDRCDASFENLSSCIDEFLESTSDLWGWEIAWMENSAFAAKYALKVSLWATEMTRPELRAA